MDNNVSSAADMFSLGLVIVALFNSPHHSPLETSFSTQTYRKILASPSTTPTPSNNYLSTQSIPKDLVSGVLPRLITRRPAQRFNAQTFQEAPYFDNVLIASIRFLDSLAAKNATEKFKFMRGLLQILPQFPKRVLERKLLPALLEETKDQDLLSLILQNVFKIMSLLPESNRAFADQVLPRLRETFVPTGKSKGKSSNQERNSSVEGGLLIVLENMKLITTHCSHEQYKTDMLPIIYWALDSPTNSVQDAALQILPLVLPILDFSTVKSGLFPVVAALFSKTSSLSIKIKGLDALSILCGGAAAGEFAGMSNSSSSGSSTNALLDRHTIQENVVPLLRAIKTKEPAVMVSPRLDQK